MRTLPRAWHDIKLSAGVFGTTVFVDMVGVCAPHGTSPLLTNETTKSYINTPSHSVRAYSVYTTVMVGMVEGLHADMEWVSCQRTK